MTPATRTAHVLRAALLAGAAVASAASASRQEPYGQDPYGDGGRGAVPNPEPMQADRALGLFRSSFGPVKIEADPAQPARIRGVWVYDRQGEEVVGYFEGDLDGNVLNFEWEEPSDPEPLRGQGYLVFQDDGATFAGRWWTDQRDRSGEWTGQRQRDSSAEAGESGPAEAAPEEDDDGAYGDVEGDGDSAEPPYSTSPEGEATEI